MRLVCAAIAIGADMRGFERRKGSLPCDRATAIVGVSDKHPERSLPEAWPYELRLAEPRLGFGHSGEVWPIHPLVHRFPKRDPLRISGIVGLEGHDIRRPTWRDGNPVGLGEKERLRQDTAADLEIAPIARICPTVTRNAGAHLLR